MKRIVLSLLCIALLAVGCATVNPCAPLENNDYVMEQTKIGGAVYTMRVYDIDSDGESDFFVVYVQKKDGTLLEVHRQDLTAEEKSQIKQYLKEKEEYEKNMEKFKEEERKFNSGQ